MTKKFCDICGSPASDGSNNLYHYIKWGNKYTSYRHVSATEVQPKIEMRINFSFKDHPLGVLSVDICDSCAVKVLGEIKDKIEIKNT